MKRFERLLIENFQSHEQTEVFFTEGLNVFVGPSDSGKSAILRALRWVLYNEPKGTDFIRAGKKRCRVSLTLSDGTEITRMRSSSVNRYILKTSEQEEQVYEGFGSSVPQEVLDAHGMHALKLDSDWKLPAQFGTQLEPPFLLAETGSVKAKSIGRASGAHIIDIALQGTARDLSGVNSRLKHVAEQSEDLKKRLEPYEDLPNLQERLEQAEARYKEAGAMHERLETIRRLKERLDLMNREKEEIRDRLGRLSGIDEASRILTEAEGTLFKQSHMKRLSSACSRIRTEREGWKRIWVETGRTMEVEEHLSQLIKVQERLRLLTPLRENLKRVQREAARQRRICSATAGIDQMDPDQLERLGRRYQVLAGLFPKVRALGREKERLQNRLRQLVHLPEEQVEKLSDLVEKRGRLLKLEQGWRDCRERLSRGRRFMADNGDEIARCTNQLAALLRELGRCPTCSSPIDDSVLEHIMEEYGGGMAGAAAGREDQTTQTGIE
ncbi:AAA family ATPase [Kroppenstedtia eburnea]|uniref:Nuclease SbcCD subunit C n=1 Tax=Kroppenstedtia eburnea TaxID=714067 RepID=A0A1N7IU01_9BACL|nr:AAA family ATPase [Kroppenstedtia eburnea]EGK13714.1 SMC protein family protein [Desmospora sp. 8437]QKI82199.1 AAA family ATPase [Kroppenstedtia eburnea]SIS40573.1 AAA domain-containing protein [Kroppenstedtia eburnea]